MDNIPFQNAPITQAEFDEIRAQTIVASAALRVDIAEAQAELARQDLLLNQAAFRLMHTAPSVPATPPALQA